MAFIELIEENDANPELAAVYAEVKLRRGSLANIYLAHGHNPQTLLDHVNLYTQRSCSKSRR